MDREDDVTIPTKRMKIRRQEIQLPTLAARPKPWLPIPTSPMTTLPFWSEHRPFQAYRGTWGQMIAAFS